MAKRIAFESIGGTEFRWPKNGDVPFCKSEDWEKNACLASDTNTRLVLMMSGYKKAADLMVEKAMSHRAERDFLVFPIIFNYRQFLELSLKYLISSYGPTVDIKPNWKSHDLSYLWNEFIEILHKYGTENPDDADPIVADIIAEFSKIDPNSFSYRYPLDTKGNPVPLSYNELDLEVLADVMRAVEGYFTGSDGYLDNLMRA